MKSTQYIYKKSETDYYILDIPMKESEKIVKIRIFHTLNHTKSEIKSNQLPYDIYQAAHSLSLGYPQTLFQPYKKREMVKSLKIDTAALQHHQLPIQSTQEYSSTVRFFQSCKKFITEHKNLLIAGTFSAGIGLGIGLTMAFFDDFVSASLISNLFLLGLLASLLVLVTLFASQYVQSSAHDLPKEISFA